MTANSRTKRAPSLNSAWTLGTGALQITDRSTFVVDDRVFAQSRTLRSMTPFLLRTVLLATLLLVTAVPPGARADDVNRCGCRQDSSGACTCERTARCGCPGECEPRGCEEARERAFQRELAIETKKADDAVRRKSHAPGDEPANASANASTNPSANPSATTAPASRAPAQGPRLTASQAKQLVRLLDVYFAESPDARSRSTGEVREQLAHRERR
jgi:hypothetical protein